MAKESSFNTILRLEISTNMNKIPFQKSVTPLQGPFKLFFQKNEKNSVC